MTAVAVPAVGIQASSAWARMIWVTWRQHRTALAWAAALLGGIAVLLVVNGLLMRASFHDLGLTACHPLSRCPGQLTLFQSEYGGWSIYLPQFVKSVPVLTGAFVGGPLFARELETGTYRFAWTQGTGRTRWVIAKLVLLALAVTAAAGAFSVLFSWWYHPLYTAGDASLLEAHVFDLLGVGFAAWTLLAFAVGAFAGVVIRRVVPAIAAAIAVWAGAAIGVALYLRPRYQEPITRHVAPAIRHAQNLIPARAYVVRSWWTAPDGQRLSTDALVARMQHLSAPVSDFKRWPFQHGYSQWAAYHPESRFWHFQAIEGAGLLAVSLLLGAAAVWWVRHRAA
jgi:hypothetical protein